MALPADFDKIFGSTFTGGLTPISDVDYSKGWEYVGSNPPTKNDFSYLQNLSDLKAQWLHNYLITTSNAASRTVGTGTGQIPDISSFSSGSTSTGNWYRLPGGLVIQAGINAVGYIGTPFTIGLPVSFSNSLYRIVASYDNARTTATNGLAMSALPSTASAFTINSSSTTNIGSVFAYWIAIGQ